MAKWVCMMGDYLSIVRAERAIFHSIDSRMALHRRRAVPFISMISPHMFQIKRGRREVDHRRWTKRCPRNADFVAIKAMRDERGRNCVRDPAKVTIRGFNPLELGGPAARHSHVHTRHHAVDPVGPQGQLRDHKDPPGSWIHSADAARRSLWVRRFVKRHSCDGSYTRVKSHEMRFLFFLFCMIKSRNGRFLLV